MPTIIPLPAHMQFTEQVFQLQPGTMLVCQPETFQIAAYLAEKIRPSSGYELPIRTDTRPGPGDIKLELGSDDPALGLEGYELVITPEQITLRASRAAGLFYAVQTLRQLFPLEVESQVKQNGQKWEIHCGTVRDTPRYAWRAMMLDVGRHFFSVDTVKRLIELLAYHKINTLHLHLSEDQGWRIMIESWPRLALHGGQTAVNGDPGGYYTQADYREIVAYAQERFITIVPEIDMPGHTNAALSSYAALNADDVAPNQYTGIRVGFSSLAVHKEITYRFINDIVREIAALTPGPYFHIGGDETHSTPEADYITFIERVQEIVAQNGKQAIGWEEIGKTRLQPGTIAQFWWNKEVIAKAAAQGNKLIMSPANRAYMDIKYDEFTPIGLAWTGSFTPVKDAYDWDPETHLEAIPAQAILGIEAALWTETIFTQGNMDFMVFPRLCGYAEIGWTPASLRNWDDYRTRLAGHGKRLGYLGVRFHRSEQVNWE